MIIHKPELPQPHEVPASLRAAAVAALAMPVREPRPAGFPLLFTSDMQLIEPAVAFLHEHFIHRAHTAETLRTYAEILVDWFDRLEQNKIGWSAADAIDLVAYRNRMLSVPSARTRHGYSIKDLVGQFDSKAGEIKALFNNTLDATRTTALRERMLCAGARIASLEDLIPFIRRIMPPLQPE